MPKRLLLSILPLILAGCDLWSINDVSFDGAEFQVSPNDKVLVVVHPQGFADIERPNLRLYSLISGIFEEFDFSDPPSTIWFIRDKPDLVIADLELDHRVDALYGSMPEDELAEFMYQEWLKLSAQYDNDPISHSVHLRDPFAGTGALVSPDRAAGPTHLLSYTVNPYRDTFFAGAGIHEQGHTWAAFPPRAGRLVHLAEQIQSSKHHWGLAGMDGLMGGIDIDSITFTGSHYLVNGTTHGLTCLKTFSPWDLYLMGLLPLEELPDLQVPINPRNVTHLIDLEEDYPKLDEEEGVLRFEADGFITYTPEDFQTGYGLSNPDTEGSRTYHALFVVISDHALSDEELDWYERGVRFQTTPGTANLEDFYPRDEFPVEWEWWGILFEKDGPLNWNMATKGLGRLESCKPIPKG